MGSETISDFSLIPRIEWLQLMVTTVLGIVCKRSAYYRTILSLNLCYAGMSWIWLSNQDCLPYQTAKILE